MPAEEELDWQDWRATLDPKDYGATEQSLLDLARYTNPAMVEGWGLGMSRSGLDPRDSNFIEMGWWLAGKLDDEGRRLSWTVDAFNPSGPGQVIRTTAELLEGAGTCLDFAITFAAMCVQERVPCVLAITREVGSSVGHAFVVIQESAQYAKASEIEIRPVDEWIGLLEAPGSHRIQLFDVTPAQGDESERASVRTRSERLLESLRSVSGHVFAVDIEAALRKSGAGWHRLPDTRRDLGLVGRLPDLPADHKEYKTHQCVRDQLKSAEGLIVLHGPSGSGKSTLALERAIQVFGGKGWFLDGSDERALRSSLADAEARSQGNRPMNLQADYLKSMTIAAHRRLRATTRPWVVVIDNAEGEPSKLIPLIPDTKAGQLVIVTTTRDGWESVVGKERVFEVEALGAEDLPFGESDPALLEVEWFPGLLRIATKSELQPELLQSQHGPVVERVVRGALGMAGTEWPDGAMARAMAAASFMPAERITLSWQAESAFGGSREDARNAIEQCVGAGLLEGSRQTIDARARDEEPIWMHRLVRRTVRDLMPGELRVLGWSVIDCYASRRRTNHYTDDELIDLCAFLEDSAPSSSSIGYGEALQIVLDLLESRGISMVKRAAALAEGAMTSVDSDASHRAAQITSTMLVARARAVNQRTDPKPTPEEVRAAIGWCEQAEAVLGDEVELDFRDLLLSGRASAMRGILIKKLATIDKGLSPGGQLELLTEALGVLTKSYRSRKQALEQEALELGREVEDPEQHIDRGWYNLGGANLDLANAVRKTEPDRVPQLLREAMAAYAGSLDLRRRLELPADNTFTAASLWGVALIAYSAALFCPDRFGLVEVQPVEELEAVMRSPSRSTLLRAAEVAGARALEMRAIVDSPTGTDTKKARDLLRKITMAWEVDADTAPARAVQSIRALGSFFDDYDVTLANLRTAIDEIDENP
jgi:hypothetical protein